MIAASLVDPVGFYEAALSPFRFIGTGCSFNVWRPSLPLLY